MEQKMYDIIRQCVDKFPCTDVIRLAYAIGAENVEDLGGAYVITLQSGEKFTFTL